MQKTILDKPWLHSFLIFLIVMGLVTVVIQSFDQMLQYQYFFYSVSFFSAIFFTIEYVLHILYAPIYERKLGRWRARKSYIISFMGFIDLIAILPFTIPYLFPDSLSAEAIELGRIFLIFKILRYSSSFTMIRSVLGSVKYELLTALAFAMMIISFSAILMYYAERKAQPEVFRNIGEGFWWAIITFTSVGYGDTYPITDFGKILTSAMVLIGIITMTLPTAIVSGALIDKLQQQRKAKEVAEANLSEKEIPICICCRQPIRPPHK